MGVLTQHIVFERVSKIYRFRQLPELRYSLSYTGKSDQHTAHARYTKEGKQHYLIGKFLTTKAVKLLKHSVYSRTRFV